jgi:hypothetical protein
MTTVDFDLNGTIIKWGCVRNKILKKKKSMYVVKLQRKKKKKKEKKYSIWLKQTVRKSALEIIKIPLEFPLKFAPGKSSQEGARYRFHLWRA